MSRVRHQIDGVDLAQGAAAAIGKSAGDMFTVNDRMDYLLTSVA